jgi:hypothetical protein
VKDKTAIILPKGKIWLILKGVYNRILTEKLDLEKSAVVPYTNKIAKIQNQSRISSKNYKSDKQIG